MDHYILVKVTETRNDSRVLDMGIVRKAIHAVAEERGFKVADVPVRGDRDYTWVGKGNPLKETKTLWDLVISRNTPEPWQVRVMEEGKRLRDKRREERNRHA